MPGHLCAVGVCFMTLLSLHVPKAAAGAGKEMSGEWGPPRSVQLLWRPRPSWSSLEAWQVEQPAAFFLPGHWNTLTGNTATFGTIPSHPFPCWPRREEGA